MDDKQSSQCWSRFRLVLTALAGLFSICPHAGAEPSSDTPDFFVNLPTQTALSFFDFKLHIEEPTGAIIKAAVWKKPGWSANGEKPLDVCWENFKDSTPALRASVKDSVSKTWQHHSMITFVGWGECSGTLSDIRIGISLSESRTVGLGQRIAGIPNGMLLRVDYSAFKRCKNDNDFCVRATAIHEFGHALGLTHEQNRDDAKSINEKTAWCIENKKQGGFPDFELTLYDPNSIMNYCNPSWNNKGMLSDKDIEAIAKLYGARA